MRYNLLIFSLLLLPAMGLAQTRKDSRKVMQQFMQFYNANDANSIATLFADRSHDKAIYNKQKIATLRYEKREMQSVTYLRDRSDGLAIYKVKFAKYTGKYPQLYPDHTGYIGLTLNRDNKIVRFHFPANPYLNDEPEHYLLTPRY